MHVNASFSLPPGAPLRPFAIVGTAGDAIELPTTARRVDGLDPSSAAFCAAMNRANCLAYDGTPTPGERQGALGMPAWVMLDCCVLPSAVFGFEVPRDALPRDLADIIDPTGTLDWVGVSEYIAIPSVREAEVVGVSLFSLAAGAGLGTRTKAMALSALNARRQVGVTQWSSPGVALHLRFGALRVVSGAVAIHSRPLETFVYAIDVPPKGLLDRIAAGERPDVPEWTGDTVTLDPRSDGVREFVESRAASVYVVGAGAVEAGALTSITLAVRDA
jgi:hypothetical protein